MVKLWGLGQFPGMLSISLHVRHDPLNKYVKLRVAHALGCRERFPGHRLQSKPLVSDPGMHHGTCVTHVPWCMSGSLTRGGGENLPGNPIACANRNFTNLVWRIMRREPVKCFVWLTEFIGSLVDTLTVSLHSPNGLPLGVVQETVGKILKTARILTGYVSLRYIASTVHKPVAQVPYPTMHHFVTNMCIGEYLSDALGGFVRWGYNPLNQWHEPMDRVNNTSTLVVENGKIFVEQGWMDKSWLEERTDFRKLSNLQGTWYITIQRKCW